MKKTFCCEWAYVAGLVLLVIATALTKRADLGLSMVVAPSTYCIFCCRGVADSLLGTRGNWRWNNSLRICKRRYDCHFFKIS